MSGTTDFIPFATGTGANVTAQATYASQTSTTSGFQSGVAPSDSCNKAWRQATFVASGVATFTANQLSINVPDDGNLANFVANYTSALTSLVSGQLLGYATEAWVNSQGFATQSWVTGQGYATQSWVNAQGYATQAYASSASNLSSGTVSSSLLPATISSNTTGNASTATTATNANYLYLTSGHYVQFQWNGQSGQPSYVFGSNDGQNVYVWNPSNFDVNSANYLQGYAPATAGTASTVALRDGSGGLTSAYFNTPSDERLKADVAPIADALEKISELCGVTFRYKDSQRRHVGLIAQNVREVIPEAVVEDENTEYLGVSYGNLVGVLIEAVKELAARVRAIESR